MIVLVGLALFVGMTCGLRLPWRVNRFALARRDIRK